MHIHLHAHIYTLQYTRNTWKKRAQTVTLYIYTHNTDYKIQPFLCHFHLFNYKWLKIWLVIMTFHFGIPFRNSPYHRSHYDLFIQSKLYSTLHPLRLNTVFSDKIWYWYFSLLEKAEKKKEKKICLRIEDASVHQGWYWSTYITYRTSSALPTVEAI